MIPGEEVLQVASVSENLAHNVLVLLMGFPGVGILVILIMITYLLINIPITKTCDFPPPLTQEKYGRGSAVYDCI